MKNLYAIGHAAQKALTIYENMPDKQLLKFAEKNYPTLRSDILPVLINELETRKIGDLIIKTIKEDSSIFLLDAKLIDSKITEIKSMNCPDCKIRTSEIVCEVYHSVLSVLLRSNYYSGPLILCKDCHRKKLWQFNLSTLTLGWWSLTGFFKTLYALLQNTLNIFSSEKILHQNMIHFVINHKHILFNGEVDLQDFIKKENDNIIHK